MTVLPFPTPNGLSSTEMAALVVFANEVGASIETDLAEGNWSYVALDFGPCYEIPAGEAVWVVSREQGKLIAYDEEDDVLLRFKSVADAIVAFHRLMPAQTRRTAQAFAG